MLSKIGIRKITVTSAALFVIGLIYLFPTKDLKIEKNINYIDEEKLSQIYMLDNNNYVSEVLHEINADTLIDKLRCKLESITNSEENKIKNFKGLIPANTKVLSIDVKDKVCTVDFSKELLGVSALVEEKMIEAIVFTLTSESEVTSVIIKVDGKVLERLPNSNKLLPNILDRSYGINKDYDINSLYNLTKTTIYYVGDNFGETYYVPVTKITNDNDEKISVIVNELKSSVMYQSNLNSYLNNKTELKNYKVEEEVMKLTFNDKIFDSIYDKNILEEVVYTIGKSVMENYDVKKVIFYVDDKEIVEAIEIYLQQEGYHVLKAYDGEQALDMLKKNEVHLLIIDVMMPKLDGIRATLKIREESSIPIIILSAKSEDSDKILGLNIGADDYVTKPFNPLELVARVKSQLRRYTQLGNVSESNETVYQVGGLMINDDLKEVTVDGELVKLTPIEYNILLLLVKNQGKVFSIEQIYENIWNEDAIGADNTVAVHIRHIREKIEINPKEPRYLKVVWGVGYKVEKN